MCLLLLYLLLCIELDMLGQTAQKYNDSATGHPHFDYIEASCKSFFYDWHISGLCHDSCLYYYIIWYNTYSV